MAFNSIEFLIFLPIVYLVYYFTGERARWIVLLVASVLFYAALDVPYLLAVLTLVAFVTHYIGLWLDIENAPKKKRYILWGGIAINCTILIVMKYLPFLSDNLNFLARLVSSNVRINSIDAFVAIGVSYYVFQAISYLVDIYLDIVKPEKKFRYFALYLAFFPKLLQGPIERSNDLLPQLRSKYVFNYDNMRAGLLLFAWGFFKKVAVADRLALYVNSVYSDVHSYSGIPLLVATYFYAMQIFLDFSGYTDMAIGCARLFNIRLTQNFNNPYFAISIADFWRRWHISFSRWILDYIFKPLQMQWRNWKNWGTASALMVTFLVSGIWHGASWSFIVWGGVHGIYLSASVFYRPVQKKIYAKLGIKKNPLIKYWQMFITFQLVCFSWVFFRSRSLADALYVVRNMFSNVGDQLKTILDGKMVNEFLLIGLGKNYLLIAIFLIFSILAVSIFQCRINILQKPVWVRWTIYYLLFIGILVFGQFGESKNFIYFQF